MAHHLGERLTEWVDGRCRPDEAARVEAHLAACRCCRDAADTERLLKSRLSCLAGPLPDDALLLRLAALGGSQGPLAPRTGRVPGTPATSPVDSPRTVARRRGDRRWEGRRGDRPADRPAGRPVPATTWSSPGRSRRRAVVVGALSLVSAGLVGSGLVGLDLAGPAVGTVGRIAPAVVSLVGPTLQHRQRRAGTPPAPSTPSTAGAVPSTAATAVSAVSVSVPSASVPTSGSTTVPTTAP